ncbi:hypothetical protein [Chitinimonas lacunae]|uniref:Uncharacterized protein n=1 Tax=Chitinimonas lacunae TaxID=1963018 RepID=A0ABV8MY13_9NEIS
MTDKLPFSPWLLVAAVAVIVAILVTAWFEMRRADLIAVRRRKIREALASFRIARRYPSDGGQELFLYAHDNSVRLLELDNQIIKYGHGSAQWLYFMPERKLFFILELVAIEPERNLHFIETIHPIKPDRARQVLARYPETYRQIFGEDI